MNKFYVFGSENSQDYDVAVEVDFIPKNINEAHDICKRFNIELSAILPDKELNCNLITIKDNTIVDCFKGTSEELVNCIYYTYDNHKQFFPNPILNPIDRDINEKVLRVARFIITFYSRTDLRKMIKMSLRGNLVMKLLCLKEIDFVKMTEFTDKKEKDEDIYKVLSFQFGQLNSLFDGFDSDSYTKNGIIKNYPDLANLLNRGSVSEIDLETLNKYLFKFINYIENNIGNLRLDENIK
jgi:hypothetical protein